LRHLTQSLPAPSDLPTPSEWLVTGMYHIANTPTLQAQLVAIAQKRVRVRQKADIMSEAYHGRDRPGISRGKYNARWKARLFSLITFLCSFH